MAMPKRQEVYVLLMTDNSGVITTAVFSSWDNCIDQIKEEFIERNEEFTDEILNELIEQQYYDGPGMRYRIDCCEVY